MALAQNSLGGATSAYTLQPYQCNIGGGTNACPSVNGGAITSTATYNSVRSATGSSAVGAIDVWGTCRYVNNATSNSIFVPFRTASEWSSFLATAPVSLTHCSKPQSGLLVYPGSYGGVTASPSTQSVSEPNYVPCSANGSGGCTNNQTWTAPPVKFTQTPGGNAAAGWTETATATFTGRDSDYGNSWKLTSTAYTAAPGSACGSANGQTVPTAPAANTLCSTGIANPQNLSGTGDWSWSCNTYQPPVPSVSCGAKQAAVCGGANGGSFIAAPSANLCSVGTASGVTGPGAGDIWSWSCNYGASTASCSAIASAVPGACGLANGSSGYAPPTSNFCGGTSTYSKIDDWNWSCSGVNGGPPASCSAHQSVDGQCGTTTTSNSTPTSGLCNVGNPSAVSGSGPWTWSCSGSYGGNSTGCTAAVGSIKEIIYMNSCGAMTGVASWGACVTDGTSNTACISGLGISAIAGPGAFITGIPPAPGMGLICSSSTNYGHGGGNDSATDGAIAKFDLSTALKGRTGSANIIVPFNAWSGIRSQAQANSIFSNYETLQSATSETAPNDGNAATMAVSTRADGEVIFIPDVNAGGVLTDMNAQSHNYSSSCTSGSTSASSQSGQDAYIASDHLTAAQSGTNCQSMENEAFMDISYDASTKLLTIWSEKGAKWKAAWRECPDSYQESLYNGYCNGKVFGQVELISPAVMCAATEVYSTTATATGTCWDGSSYPIYPYQIQNQGNQCGNTSSWITPPSNPTGPSCPKLNIGCPFC